MSDTLTNPPLFAPAKKEATGPKPVPGKPPVFIMDAVTPIGGETLLLALLRAQSAVPDDQP